MSAGMAGVWVCNTKIPARWLVCLYQLFSRLQGLIALVCITHYRHHDDALLLAKSKGPDLSLRRRRSIPKSPRLPYALTPKRVTQRTGHPKPDHAPIVRRLRRKGVLGRSPPRVRRDAATLGSGIEPLRGSRAGRQSCPPRVRERCIRSVLTPLIV